MYIVHTLFRPKSSGKKICFNFLILYFVDNAIKDVLLLSIFKNFYCYSITVVWLFSPSLHPPQLNPPPSPTSTSPPRFCPCVLYNSSCNPLFPLSPPHSPLDPKTMVYLHNGILRSREKEGTYPLCNSMDEIGEHYAKWNKPGSDGQIPCDLTFNCNIINKRKKQKKI